MKKTDSNNEILDRINALANSVETIDKNMKEGFAAVMEHIVDIRETVNGHDEKFESMASDIKELKSGQKRLEDSIWEMRSELNDIKKRLERIEKRTMEDDDAMASEIVTLKKRVLVLETKLNKSA